MIDEMPSRPDEMPAARCETCGSPSFPPEPGVRTISFRCPNGHWQKPPAGYKAPRPQR